MVGASPSTAPAPPTSPATSRAVPAAIDPADAELRFWEARVGRDPADHLSPTRLGVLYLRRARLTGEASLNAKAERALRLALDRFPGHPPALIGLARAYAAQHKFPDAIDAARRALDAAPKDPEALGVLGDAYLESGDLAKAGELYARLTAALPGLFAWTRTANLKYATGDTAGAIADYLRAADAGRDGGAPPEDVAWCHLQAGQLAFGAGDWPAAEKQYAAARDLDPDGYAVLDHLAELRAAEQKYDEAVALYRRAIDRAPRPELCQALGDVFKAAGRAHEAQSWHARALEGYLAGARAGDAHHYHHLAGYYCDVERNGAEAVRWARKDLELRRTAAAYDALAWALHHAGDPAAAADAMDRALATGVRDAHILYHASQVYFRAGQPAKGKDCLRRAAEVNPQFNAFHAHR